MNRCFLILAGVLLITGSGKSQTTPVVEPVLPNLDKNGEFPIYPNGLIYSAADMTMLRHIVDSLNIRFRSCEPNKSYRSLPQKRLYQITFASNTNDLKQIINAIEADPSPAELLSSFKEYVKSIDSTKLLVRTVSDYDIASYPDFIQSAIRKLNIEKDNDE